MQSKLNTQVNRLINEFNSNNKSIPDSWIPYLTLIILGLKIAKIFTNDKIDQVIDEILIAIDNLKNP